MSDSAWGFGCMVIVSPKRTGGSNFSATSRRHSTSEDFFNSVPPVEKQVLLGEASLFSKLPRSLNNHGILLPLLSVES